MTGDLHKDREPSEKERLSTADLADAGRNSPVKSEENNRPPDVGKRAAAVEVVHFSHLDERRRDKREGEQLERHDEQTLNAPSQPVESRSEPVTTIPRQSTAGQAVSAQGTGAATATAKAPQPEQGPLFSAEEAARLRSQWDSVQVGFVDEPRKAVQEADSLVAVAMKRLAEQFAEERSKLESQWDRGGDVSTEDLRLALRRYRSFFGRLLTV